MMRIMLKSKIHRARVTEANLEYEGSVAIDKRLMDEADIRPYEQVQVLNANNGARFITYAIEAPTDSGMIGIQGPAARLVSKDDTVIILTYRNVEEAEVKNFLPRLVYVDENNVITKTKHIVDAIPF
ncbi:MAG: aspartate 1-decarboxylase, partial [Dehalococcoidia bacterium]